jgi:hypothetical protein
VRYLEEALKYTPRNEIILYSKAPWKYQQALIEEDLDTNINHLKSPLRS